MESNRKILKKPDKTEKPICLRMEEAKAELVAAVNRCRDAYGLPFFIIEPLLKDIYFQTVDGKKAELEAAQKSWAANADTEQADDGAGGVTNGS